MQSEASALITTDLWLKTLKLTRRVKEMCSVSPDIVHTIVLVGGGMEGGVLPVPTKLPSVVVVGTDKYPYEKSSGAADRQDDHESYGEGYTDIIFKGNVDERKFLALYMKDDVVVAAASLMFDPAVSHLGTADGHGPARHKRTGS
ncbi:unnamed protein product, partial [Lampetra planeri]